MWFVWASATAMWALLIFLTVCLIAGWIFGGPAAQRIMDEEIRP